MNKISFTIIVLVSFLLAIACGMADYETKSLVHLFTAEWGNVIMLCLLTSVFSTVGCLAWLAVSAVSGKPARST